MLEHESDLNVQNLDALFQTGKLSDQSGAWIAIEERDCERQRNTAN